MNRYLTLIKGDIKNIFRDGVLIMIFIAPVLLCTLFKLGIPFIKDILINYNQFDLTSYYDLITAFVVLVMTMLIGFMTGLILIEEKDEGLFLYYTITPLGKNGYLFYRLSLPLIINFFLSFLLIRALGFISISLFQLFLIIVLASLQSLIYVLLLTSLSSNRVEAMAIGKALGIIMIIPIIDRISDFSFDFIYYLVPTYYIGKAFEIRDSSQFYLIIIIGFVIHVIYIYLLYRYFMKKNQ